MQFAELNNITLHYQVLSAPANKPVLVFINSLGTDFRIWRDVIINFAGDFAMVAYDKRGHGLSSAGKSPYKMDDHVSDLIALLDHLSVKNAILCGVSVGGLIAQGVFARRPDLIRGLVLCDTGHKIGTDEVWNDRISTVQADGIKALADATMTRWFSPEFHEEQPAALQGYQNMLERQSVDGYVGTCVAIRDTDYTEIAKSITVPTLCVVGDQDGATPPELVSELAGLINGSEFQIIEGAGHIPSIEQADRLSDLMKRFFATRILSASAAETASPTTIEHAPKPTLQ